jgi:thiamine-monophosphate kinase
MNEFELIQQYFAKSSAINLPIGLVGIGDDAALLPIDATRALAVSTDSLLEGVHFFADMPAHALGFKSLAVNLSDLAAMGATPKYFMLALHLPSVNETWLDEFQQGLFTCAKQYAVTLVGGDTCRSQQGIGINITVMGEVDRQQALLRSRAQIGDAIYVTGCLGESALGLLGLQKKIPINAQWLQSHYYPQPQLPLGQALLGVAHSAIDISDGLLADLGHILKASGVGARLDYQRLPLARAHQHLPFDVVLQSALTGGEDYQLCFTVPEEQRPALNALATHFPLIEIGEIVVGDQVTYAPPLPYQLEAVGGFKHF